MIITNVKSYPKFFWIEFSEIAPDGHKIIRNDLVGATNRYRARKEAEKLINDKYPKHKLEKIIPITCDFTMDDIFPYKLFAEQ